jgi:hypothetical protein
MTFATNTAIEAEEWTPPTSARRAPPNIHEDTFLTRRELSEALRELGFRYAPATLATYVTRGGGPPFQHYGRNVAYRWGPSLAWALGRLSRPITSSAEADRLT